VFNIPTAQVERVIPMDKWSACAWPKDRGEFPDLTGRPCFAGLDVASHEDLTALVLYFPPVGDESRGYLKSWFWCPESKILERERKQLAYYGTWARENFILQTSGDYIDPDPIVATIRECGSKYTIRELLYDKWGAESIINAVQFEQNCVRVEQGPVGMADYCKGFLGAVVGQKLWHDGNPVMTWCCGNAAAETKPDIVWFSKKKSSEKIDGVIAAAMAVGRGTIMPATSPEVFAI